MCGNGRESILLCCQGQLLTSDSIFRNTLVQASLAEAKMPWPLLLTQRVLTQQVFIRKWHFKYFLSYQDNLPLIDFMYFGNLLHIGVNVKHTAIFMSSETRDTKPGHFLVSDFRSFITDFQWEMPRLSLLIQM